MTTEALREWIEAYWYDAIPKDELLARLDADPEATYDRFMRIANGKAR